MSYEIGVWWKRNDIRASTRSELRGASCEDWKSALSPSTQKCNMILNGKNKLLLVGDINYLKNIRRRILTFSREGPCSKFSLYFSSSCIPTDESLFLLLALSTQGQTVHYYKTVSIQIERPFVNCYTHQFNIVGNFCKK